MFVFTLVVFAENNEYKPGVYSPKDVEKSFNLKQLITLAYENNPKVGSMKSSWQAKVEKYPQAVSLDDPMFKIGYFVENVETKVGPQEYRFMVTQKIPFPGTLSKKGEITSLSSKMSKEMYERSIRDVIVDIKINYFELLYLNNALDITAQNDGLLKEILKDASTRYAKGNAVLNDVLKAESQLAQLSYDVITIRELKEVIKEKLISLAGLSGSLKLGEPEQLSLVLLDLKIETLYEIALSEKQEIKIAGLKERMLRKKVELVDKMNKPMFTLGASYIKTGPASMPNAADSGKDPILVEIGFSVPLWGSKNRSKSAEVELNVNSAVLEKKNIENNTRSAIKEIYFRAENSKRLIKLYSESLIPQAAKAMELAQDWSEKDTGGSISEFLETQGIWLNFNLAYQRAVTDYRQHLARLEKVVGGDLQ